MEEIFKWTWNDNKDDGMCVIGDYTLRVEQMDKGHWWWRVSFKGNEIITDMNEWSQSKYRAIGLSEGLYLGHSKTNNI